MSDLAEAAATMRQAEARLHDLLAQVRHEQARYIERLREVEQSLSENAARVDAEGDRHHPEQSAFRDKHESLKAQRAAIGEKLSQLQLSVRKLRAVISQSQMSADYLAGHVGDTDEDLLSLTQVWALEAQEEERRRLAREIHDGPAQVLANATFQLEYCQRLLERDPTRFRSEFDRVKQDLRDGLAEVRYFIFDLRPGPLAELGLAATLQRYCENFQSRSGIVAELDLDYDARLSPTKEVAIFRIAQEALQNARKHSAAKRVWVRLNWQDDGIHLTVRDDGKGFDPKATAESGGRHFGLTSMEERARLIRAELRVASAPGEGTCIDLRVKPEGEGS